MLLPKRTAIIIGLLPFFVCAEDVDERKRSAASSEPGLQNLAKQEAVALSASASEEQGSNGDEADFVFDNNMFRGSHINQAIINRLSKENHLEPNRYDVMIKVNAKPSGQDNVTVALVNNRPEICLSKSILNKAGFLPEYETKLGQLLQKRSCVTLAEIIPQAKVHLATDLTLDFSAPQAVLREKNANSVDIAELSEGVSAGFINYTFNQYHNEQSGQISGSSDYSYANIHAGINLGLWQFRQLSTYSYSSSRFDGEHNSAGHWHNIASYVQRALPQIQSKLVIGETNTTGQFLSGLSYTGLELASDERMLPTSKQGYAPRVSGIAKTNALVEVQQNGVIIYQTTVPAGAFELRDLNPTSYDGDLDVTVKEADGSTSTFSVPFSAVPDSIRPGHLKYSVATGKTRDTVDDRAFFDSNVQYGLSNAFTLGGGLRLAKDYQAGLVNGVFANGLGAFGLNVTYSNAKINDDNRHQGWMTSLTYSKMFQPTETYFSLAGYRYSTEGYREFSDFINEQYSAHNSAGASWSSSTYLQQYRLTAAISQPLDGYGNLGLSASTQEYRDNRPRDIQYQLSYGKILPKNISMSINLSRQRNSRFNVTDSNEIGFSPKYDTLTMVSFNIPLSGTRSSLSSSAIFDKNNGNTYQTSLGGNFGAAQAPYSYSINANYDQQGHQTAYAANLSKQYPLAAANLNASRGKNYWQLGGGLTGSLVAHSGGIIAGPYLGDTFAIVEAKGAEGARIYNGQGATINQFGYALVPSLTPYRYNSIAITPEGMLNNNVDITAGEQRIAPYSGAAIRVKFGTNTGYPLLIALKTNDNGAIPMGAAIIDSHNQPLGVVGQNNQAYLRAPEKNGQIRIVWGDKSLEQCSVTYSIKDALLKESLIKITAKCL